MKPISRRSLIASLAALAVTFGLSLPTAASAQPDLLPSWNDGPAKQAIVNFVKATTDQSSPNFVPPEARIATFDQDGTLWVEHPIYTQLVVRLGSGPGPGQGQTGTGQCRTL